MTAFDDAEIIELLTYKLSPVVGNSEDHAESFSIHAETGQIMVSPSAKLGAEEDDTKNPDNAELRKLPTTSRSRPRTATVPPKEINVKIWVVGVDEPPILGRNYVDAIGEHAIGDRVPTEMSHKESDRTIPNRRTDRHGPGHCGSRVRHLLRQ